MAYNVLVILVDQQRYPPCYETAALAAFRRERLRGQEALREHAVEFHRHYAAATACVPSRASLLTGHYPGLHGVSQTDGLAKHPFDPEMTWLAPGAVPTLGDYFRAAGYRTFYKGKWHVSAADLDADGGRGPLPTNDRRGRPLPAAVARYLAADSLDPYGFSGWIGPEPHGPARGNSGVIRDPGFARQTIDLLDRLAAERRAASAPPAPWLIVASFVNPHDIVLWGPPALLAELRLADRATPRIPAPPTRRESLATKPSCQRSYLAAYRAMLPPQPPIGLYRRAYYALHARVDREIARVYDALRRSCFYDDTIVVFTADHGELLGAHGGLQQKWHNAYEEAIHVPLLIANPRLFPRPAAVDAPTSHVDLLPTLLGLAGLDAARLQETLHRDHTRVRPLVGRDLSRLALGRERPDPAGPAVYFRTDDEISRGPHQRNARGRPYDAVAQPNHVETVIAAVPGDDGVHLCKFSRYFDDPRFWSEPGLRDVGRRAGRPYAKTASAPDEYELYDLRRDPLETRNLAHPANQTRATIRLREELAARLEEARSMKYEV